MGNETITLGNNFNPPVIDMDVTQGIYEHIRSEKFEVDVFNSLLASVVVYCDTHGVDYDDSQLPWAESIVSE